MIIQWLINFLQEVVKTFLEMAPYLMLGLVFAGILHVLFKKEYVVKHLGQNDAWSVVKAAALGVPLPLCSCGVVPTALSLRKNGASQGATMSFLISTPQTGVDSIAATYGMLGPLYAIFRPLAALLMGIVGGLVTNFFYPQKSSPVSVNNAFSCVLCDNDLQHDHSWWHKINGMIRYAFADFLDDISLQLAVGIVLSAIISMVIPADFFNHIRGGQFVEMIIMSLVGIPLYVCATASIPIAMALMAKGLSPGAAFVFLATGPATNSAAMVLIGNVLGRKFLIIFIAVIAVCSMVAGAVLNWLYAHFSGLFPQASTMNHYHHQETGSVLMVVVSIVFLCILLLSYWRRFKPAIIRIFKSKNSVGADSSSTMVALDVEGMTCSKCAAHVTESVEKVAGVTSVKVDVNGGTVAVSGTADRAAVMAAVIEAGYKVKNQPALRRA